MIHSEATFNLLDPMKGQEGMDTRDSLEVEWKGLEKQTNVNGEKGVKMTHIFSHKVEGYAI